MLFAAPAYCCRKPNTPMKTIVASSPTFLPAVLSALKDAGIHTEIQGKALVICEADEMKVDAALADRVSWEGWTILF